MQSMQALFVSPFFPNDTWKCFVGQMRAHTQAISKHLATFLLEHSFSFDVPSFKKKSGKLSLRHCLEKLMTSGVNLASTWGFRILPNLVLTFAPKFRFSALWYRTNVVACVVFLPSRVCSLV